MMTYAKHTKVSVTRSKSELEGILRKFGATSYASGWDDLTRKDTIEFTHHGVRIQMSIRQPDDDPKGQLHRVRWRTLLLVVKAKLAAVECKISTFEQECLHDVMTSNGVTIGARIMPQLEALILGKANLGRLLPVLPEAGT